MTTGATALALEFRGTADSTGTFRFAAKNTPVNLVRMDPLVDHVERPLRLAKQAELVVQRLPEAPRLILTYCGTAALGLRVATLVEAPCLLVDPFVITADDMRRDFLKMCDAAGVTAPPEAEPHLPVWEATLLGGRAGMAARYGGDSVAYELVDDVLARYTAWLRFLHASSTARRIAVRGEVSLITARSAQRWLPLLERGAEPLVQEVPDGVGILDLPEVRQRVLNALRTHCG